MSVAISRAAVAAVAERMRTLVPANISPFFTDALREAAAERVLRDLQRSGWELVSAAELDQLLGQARALGDARAAVAACSAQLRALTRALEDARTAQSLGVPVDMGRLLAELSPGKVGS